ncbi:hypothetical protein KCH_71470 [Kitasatospora cheerisanensis KCTC 2395]|uniref:Uncharacterized protein n=1 Tax=Kitasatospora cheerisanensis KCTC 2395 TaxID=1348663 RepID=A0A066YHS2_9ACTN|nr:hypothetical protein KCH_71470 [Kitasatospora cheerisanensis KCTC 2395]
MRTPVHSAPARSRWSTRPRTDSASGATTIASTAASTSVSSGMGGRGGCPAARSPR